MDGMSGSPKRILVAEDHPALARVLAFTLKKAGFEVTVCNDGAAAWEAVQDGNFDGLATDYEMPHMDGEELCTRIRATERLAHIPVIMVTGRELQLDVRRMKSELNIAAIYPKPYSPKKVVHLFNQLLQDASSTGSVS
jgi:CheY-like chemotaxis protein